MQRGIAAYRGIGAALGVSGIQAWLAEQCCQAGRIEEGQRMLSDSFELLQRTHEGAWSAELSRLKGELLLRSSVSPSQPGVKKRGRSELPNIQPLTSIPQTEAEECFHTALDSARQQQAKSLELRAAMSLARLWRSQDKRHAAYHILSEIYNWFTEGFDTADLKDAKTLLEELSSRPVATSHRKPVTSAAATKKRRTSKKLRALSLESLLLFRKAKCGWKVLPHVCGSLEVCFCDGAHFYSNRRHSFLLGLM